MSRLRRPLPTGLAVAVALAGCAAPPEPADLVLTGGRVVTVDDALPEAEAVAVRDGRIVAVGTSSVSALWSATRRA